MDDPGDENYDGDDPGFDLGHYESFDSSIFDPKKLNLSKNSVYLISTKVPGKWVIATAWQHHIIDTLGNAVVSKPPPLGQEFSIRFPKAVIDTGYDGMFTMGRSRDTTGGVHVNLKMYDDVWYQGKKVEGKMTVRRVMALTPGMTEVQELQKVGGLANNYKTNLPFAYTEPVESRPEKGRGEKREGGGGGGRDVRGGETYVFPHVHVTPKHNGRGGKGGGGRPSRGQQPLPMAIKDKDEKKREQQEKRDARDAEQQRKKDAEKAAAEVRKRHLEDMHKQEKEQRAENDRKRKEAQGQDPKNAQYTNLDVSCFFNN